jgi:hypothetical protein
MIRQKGKIFLTAEVAKVVDVPEWRVIKIAGGEEYGIKPRRSAKGSGSRRVYDVENVCEIALAIRLLETGLRPKVIGEVIARLRQTGGLRTMLGRDIIFDVLQLAIARRPQIGRPLNQSRKQHIQFIIDADQGGDELPEFYENARNELGSERYDILFVALGPMFQELKKNLKLMAAKDGEE